MRTRVAMAMVTALVISAGGMWSSTAPASAGSLPTMLVVNSGTATFYEYNATYPAPDPGAFDARNLKLPPFATVGFDNVDFNPASDSPIVSACNNIPGGFAYESQIPFTNVDPNGDGSCTFTAVPGAGDTHPTYESTIVGSVTAPARGTYALRVTGDDGWLLGMGTRVGGAEKPLPVAGPLVNASGKTAASKLPIMAGSNRGQSPTPYDVLVFFPAAGDYPFEADHVQAFPSQATFTMFPEAVTDPNVSIADADLVYGGDSGNGRSFKIQVALSRPVDHQVTIDYTITDGSAVNNEDYKIKKTTGTIIFKPGMNGLTPVSKSLSIPILAPRVHSGDLGFDVTLSNPQGGLTINNELSSPTIIDSDSTSPAPRVGVSPLMYVYSGQGKARSAVVPVTLSAPQAVPVTVQFDTFDQNSQAGVNYKAVHKTVTFKPGQVQKTVAVPLYVYDGNSSGDFGTQLSNPSGGLALSDYGFGPGTGQVLICSCVP